jgi:hypothetical protein
MMIKLLMVSGMMRMLVLRLFLLLVFCHSLPLSSWPLLLLLRCGITFASGISPLVTLFIYLWSVRSMLSSRVIPVLRSSTHRVQLFGISLTLSALLSVVLAPVAGLCGLIWSFSEYMSFCLGFVQSLSPDVLS